ncbi:hypothetical protein FOVG_19455 [Fusarium oxysporum f. sp. pisi HDV247]|uniref:Uncharacterized protein n=1 Tax=Fusarium oxysporum f. sp. pisi HDV247 TaxID=1080344 RepID=W9NE36_FUSOX|nr:hypothetical protein FOVG_19455 [Fusarium oxysporum f. sp. pisi HDV247]
MAPHTDIATRAFIVSLKAPCSGKSSNEVSEITGISVRQVDRIYGRAISRGFDPNIRPLILKNEYLEDAPRSGRPTKKTDEAKQLIIGKLTGCRDLRHGYPGNPQNLQGSRRQNRRGSLG